MNAGSRNAAVSPASHKDFELYRRAALHCNDLVRDL
jgi:hypothetical protein